MNKQLNFSFKDAWLAANGILLFVSMVSWLVRAENVFGVSGTILFLLSYPANLILRGLLLEIDSSFSLPAITLLMLFSFSAIGYVQWFILVPRLTNFFGRKFSKLDVNIDLNIDVKRMQQITEPSLGDMRLEGWEPNFYDEDKNSPVERLIYVEKNRL